MTSALALLRRWVLDYFNRHDDEAAQNFATPDYALKIADVVLAGRDDSWLPAVAEQMRLFPGLGMTVHQTILGEAWAAVWFSEHGASKGRVACWSGVAIYFSEGGRLTGCVAQENYLTRRRQLQSGVADPVEPPAAAPGTLKPNPATSMQKTSCETGRKAAGRPLNWRFDATTNISHERRCDSTCGKAKSTCWCRACPKSLFMRCRGAFVAAAWRESDASASPRTFKSIISCE